MGIKFIMPARPHVFMDGILDPIHRHMVKIRRKNSKVEEHNIDELD